MFDMIDIVVLILLGILTVPLMLDFSSKFKFKIRNELLKIILCLLWVICMLFFEIADLIIFFV